MELHALPHLEDPPLVVLGIDMPFGEQAGRDIRQLVGVQKIPIDDAVIGGIAEKAVPLAAIVGNAGHGGQIGRRHRDAQGLGMGRRGGSQHRRKRNRCQGGCYQRGLGGLG